MLADQKSQKVHKDNAFEKPMWIKRARVTFTDMEELVLRHSLEALTISDVKRWTRLIIHEFIVQIEEKERTQQMEDQQQRDLHLQRMKEDLKEQFKQVQLDSLASAAPSKDFLTPRQSTMMLNEEDDKQEVKSNNVNEGGGYRWMSSFFTSAAPKSPASENAVQMPGILNET